MSAIVKEKSQSNLRWLVLFFTSLMMIANYYAYDIPAALNSQMDEYFGQKSDFQTSFSLLYTLYSVPNVILPFFGGFFVDKAGVRICLLVFMVTLSVGSFVFALGLSIKSWGVMYLGRVIYGFGGESLSVANSALLTQWFKGKEMAFAFGLNLSIARLGSVINNVVSPTLADNVDIQFAFWFGVILCGGGTAAVLAINAIDKSMEIMLKRGGLLTTEDNDEVVVNWHDDTKREQLTGNLVVNDAREERTSRDEDETPHERTISMDEAKIQVSDAKFSDVFKFKQIFWIMALICVVVYGRFDVVCIMSLLSVIFAATMLSYLAHTGCVLPFNNIASPLLLERDYFKEPPSSCHLDNPYQCESGSNDAVDCPSSKWYQPPLPLNVSSSDIDCSEDYWKDTCTKTYCDRLTDAQLQANTIMSIPYIISAVLSPFLGGFVDKFAGRAIIATFASLALAIVHIFLGFTDVSPVGPLVGQGLAYSAFAAVIWPSVALIVPESLVGLAYGVVVSIQNIGLAAFPLVIATIYQDSDNKYIPDCEVFFITLAWLGVLIGLYMNFYDFFVLNSKLNIPGRHESQHDELLRDSLSAMDEKNIRNSLIKRNSQEDYEEHFGLKKLVEENGQQQVFE
jgi:MFS family permease